MAKSQFGKRIAHGLMGIAWAHGLMYRLDLLTESCIALLGVEDWKMIAPVFIGDTLHVEITVKELIPSRSKPDRGVLKLYFELVNQNGVVCQTGIKALMMKRKTQ
jgi:acyl dehydratase